MAVSAQLLLFRPSLSEHINLLRKNAEFVEPQLLIRAIAAIVPREVFFTPSTFTLLYWVMVVTGVLALLGWYTRTSLFVFACLTWIFVAHLFSYGDRHHTEAIFCIFLMLLAFAPSGERLSVDAYLRARRGQASADPARTNDTSDMALWPLKVVHVLLAITYFSAGMAKVLTSGIVWLNGYTLQRHAFGDAVTRGFPFGVWVAQHHTLAVALSVFTILFELGFVVSLFVPWTQPLFFLGGLGFHIGLYATGGYDFFQHMVLLVLLLLFLAPPWWGAWLEKVIGTVHARPAPRRVRETG